MPPNSLSERTGLHLLVEHARHPPVMAPLEPLNGESIALSMPSRRIRVHGVVRDDRGVMADAEVLAASVRQFTTTVVSVRTSSSGQFEMVLPQADETVAIAVNDPDHEPIEIPLKPGTADDVPIDIVVPLVEVGIQTDGFIALRVPASSPDVSPATDLGTFELGRAAEFTIEVRTPTGSPVADAPVTLTRGIGGPRHAGGRTPVTGKRTLAVEPGTYTLTVSALGFPDHYEEVAVDATESRMVTLSEAATLRARVVWADMTPAEGVSIRALPARPTDAPGTFDILPGQPEAKTEKGGRVVFEGLGTGPSPA